ncbi:MULTISPECIES: FAD-binding protein [unclassified Streptomyces]|uniref:FAD-dependent oxidoreductase n=1 Tax=unclassified Streptomyces TaxID=2593676 RepID=UPI002252ECC8|nr:FAD-binding oxidoreductase [Streptomyces sp. NBC_00439]MCX5102850.1 FAD-binding oxidoreductase [Streptomyces sp. NBC_00439]
MSVDTVSLTGWGRTAPTTAVRFRPRSYEEAAATVRGCGPRGSIARGLGRAHGDAAQNAGGSVLDMTALNRIRTVDAAAGLVVCDAGVSLHRLTEVLLPLGWFVPVTPTTRYVTVGGAVGADIHGHNQHISGSFSRHVQELELLSAEGEIRTVRPGTALFDATAGGLGLTGVILSATLRCHRVTSSWMSVDTERAVDLDDLLERLGAGDHRYRYSAAWIDLRASGRATGRSVLTRGEHVPRYALPARARRTPLSFRPGPLPAAPTLVPEALLGGAPAALLNEVRYRGAPRYRIGELQRLAAFFHPLDGLPHRNRIHGRAGSVRYQFAVGHGREETLRRTVHRISRRRWPATNAVLKRFGAGDPGWLSFPVPGWTLALDLPAALPGLAGFLDSLDEEVAAAGGRVCLAKDSRLRPELLAAMYPRLADFRSLRAELDPAGAFRSDLSRRLSL